MHLTYTITFTMQLLQLVHHAYAIFGQQHWTSSAVWLVDAGNQQGNLIIYVVLQ